MFRNLFKQLLSGNRDNRRSNRLGQKHRRLSMEALESRQLLSITLSAGTSIFVPLNGSSSGSAANFSVTVSDYSKLTPVIMPQTNKSLQLNVNINGVSQSMVFQLLDNLAPNTAAYIEALAQSGFYNGLSIYRNGKDSSGNPFVIQGGNDPPTGAIKTDQSSIAEEFNPELQFTSAGILAMARTSTPSSSSTEFFITEEPARFLDYSYTIFGIQTVGTSVINTIEAMPNQNSTQDPSGIGYLATPLTITSASIFTDVNNGVLELSAPAGVTGTVTVTVTTSDGTNTPTTQSFTVLIQADSASNPADPFASSTPSAPTSVTYVPPAGVTDNQNTNLDNSASSKTLQFQVTGVTSGNVVEVLADGTPIGQATASGTTVIVTTNGSTDLTDGLHTITAIQIAKNKTVSIIESGSSTAANFTADIPSLNTSTAIQLAVDTLAPQLAFTPSPTAVVGVPYFCQAAVSPGSGSGITYQLTQSPTEMSIDANTGKITWTPAQGQQSPVQVTVQATDAVGNTGQQQYAINVLASNAAPIILTKANPSLGTTNNVTTSTIHLATFVNNGSGTTLITDTDNNPVLGGIALIGATGKGTWQYSLDGTTFIAVDAVSESSSLLLANNAVLRYIPDGKSDETSSVTYCAWDTTGGANGVRADLSQSGAVGGSTAFSANTDTAKLTIIGGSLSGYVYFDSNNDGQMAGSETRLAGVTVRIYSQNSGGNWTEVSGISPVQTNAQGSYSFQGLAGGTYQIKVDTSSKVLVGQGALGTIAGIAKGSASNGKFQIQLGASENGTDYNFCVLGLQPALLSLRMFLASTPPMTQVIQNMHAAPEVSLSGAGGNSGYNTTYVSHTNPVEIASSGASISSPDSSTLTSMTVTIQNLQDGSDEQLQADTSGTSITSSYANGVLTLSGVADVSTYQALLRKVKYSDTASSPVYATRAISVVVNDGTAASAAVTTSLSFINGTAPSGYSITANQTVLNSTTSTSTGFTFAGAQVGATFNYTISSDGGGTPITGSGTVSSATQKVTGINVSTLTDGTLTFSVKLTNIYGNAGNTVTATASLDRTLPSGYSITADQPALNSTTATSTGFAFAGAQVGATYNYIVSSNGGGTPITGNGIITSATQHVTGINISSLVDGGIVYYVTLTDPAGNVGASTVASTVLDRVAPSGYSITADQQTLDNSTASSAGFTFTNAEVSAAYSYTVTSSGGGGTVTGNGTISSSSQQVMGINVAMLPNGTLTFSVTLTDAAGNIGSAATVTETLTQTAPAGYTITSDHSALNVSTATSAGFTFAGAQVGATYAYTISSSGGGTPVTGSGTVTSATQDVTGINVSSLPDGTLTFSVALTNGEGAGGSTSATSTLNQTVPSGYSITANQTVLNAATASSAGFTFVGAEAGATYSYTISSSGGGTPVTGSGTVSSADQNVTGINVSSLPNGTLTFSVKLTNIYGNSGNAATATASLDGTPPSGYSITADQTALTAATASSAGFTFTGAEVGALYTYSISSTGGGTPVVGSGTVSSASFDVTGINVLSLPNGTLTISFKLTDLAGNIGTVVTATTALNQ
jgi:large repetitive protein